MRPVRVLPSASADIYRLTEPLADLSPRASAEAASRLTAAVLSLSDFPNRGAPAPVAGYRELVVRFGRDGFIIRYQVTPKEVRVTRIFHGREQR